MKLKKVLVICLIILMALHVIAQEETIVGEGEVNKDQENQNIQAKTLSVVTNLNEKLNNAPTKAEFNDNFQQLDSRIQFILVQTISFAVIVLLINDILLISLFFILKSRGYI